MLSYQSVVDKKINMCLLDSMKCDIHLFLRFDQNIINAGTCSLGGNAGIQNSFPGCVLKKKRVRKHHQQAFINTLTLPTAMGKCLARTQVTWRLSL